MYVDYVILNCISVRCRDMSNVVPFIRRNIVIILTIPPVIALGFGAYAKAVANRPTRQSTSIVNTVQSEPETMIQTDVLKE